MRIKTKDMKENFTSLDENKNRNKGWQGRKNRKKGNQDSITIEMFSPLVCCDLQTNLLLIQDLQEKLFVVLKDDYTTKPGHSPM